MAVLLKVPLFTHPVLSPPFEAYIKMLFRPVNVPLNVMLALRMTESPDVVTEVVLTWHWLFCRMAVLTIGFVLDPAPLSHKREILP